MNDEKTKSLEIDTNFEVKNEKNGQNYTNFAKNEEISKKNIKKKNKTIKALAIATSILALSTIGLGVAYGITQAQSDSLRYDLENVYEKNFYNLLDSVNTAENDLSKVLVSSGSSYQTKLLNSVAKASNEAQISVAGLPLTQSDISDMVRMVNQIYGYTSTLSDKIAKGGTLSESELATLEEVYQNVLTLKNELNSFARKMQEGYSILDESTFNDDGTTNFTNIISQMSDLDVKYPTMIYDGPFSDSVVNSEVKGLTGANVSQEEAEIKIEKHFKNLTTLSYQDTTKGKFETYNFRAENSNNETLYIQVTKIGGHILTVSGAGKSGASTVSEDNAKKIALEFAKNNGVENGQVVWSDSLYEDLYLNIAPVQNGIVLYPDLVKVKIDMTSGTVVGYDATTYFTNHTARSLSKGSLTKAEAEAKIPSSFTIVQSRIVLSPLDYNREVVCYEVEATKDDNTYYFYFNTEDGGTENILKVIKTDNGSLLM